MAFKIVTKTLILRQQTSGLGNPIVVQKIIKALFLHVELSPREVCACTIQTEELFTLKELKKSARTLKNGKAPGNAETPNEILKEVTAVYLELLLTYLMRV